MREKLKNKKGFTLAELLIVVAIIAVLVAIMIPVFGASQKKAILARDTANMRSLYAQKLMEEMATANNLDSIEVEIKKSEMPGGKFDCSVNDLSSNTTSGEDIVVQITIGEETIKETIYVDDGVIVKLTGF